MVLTGSYGSDAEPLNRSLATDEQLVARSLEGDQTAFTELCSRYQRPLFNAAYRLLGAREEAKDVVQEALMKCYARLGQFDSERKFFSWIYRIAINEALDRSRARGRFVEDSAEELLKERAIRPTALADLEVSQLQRRVHRTIGMLPENDRAVLVLRHIGELSYEEVAEVLEISVEKVRSRLFSARQKLRRLLERGVGAAAP